MISPRNLTGCIPAVATPVDGFGRLPPIDYEHLKHHLTNLMKAGITKFVLAATTGMGSLLNEKEHLEVVRFGAKIIRDWHEKNSNLSPIVIAGASSNSTAEAVNRTINLLSKTDIDAVLHTTGYYIGSTPTGLLAHFTAIAKAASYFDAAIILYNVPSRTGVNFSADTISQLANHPNIIGIKEASGDLEQIKTILENTNRQSFAVLSGEDDQVANIIELGGLGVISASANIWPEEFIRLCELALNGVWFKAMELQHALAPCIAAVFPPGVKNPQAIQHMLQTGARLPLVSLNQLEEKKREECLKLINRALTITNLPHL